METTVPEPRYGYELDDRGNWHRADKDSIITLASTHSVVSKFAGEPVCGHSDVYYTFHIKTERQAIDGLDLTRTEYYCLTKTMMRHKLFYRR